jgi:hypothetical protein
VPYIEVPNNSSRVEHEATTSKVDEDQLFYCRQRGMDEEEAVALVVNGFCKEVLQALPMEFAMEAQKLVAISLEGSVEGNLGRRDLGRCWKSRTCTSSSRKRTRRSSRAST